MSHGNTSVVAQESVLEERGSCGGQASALGRVNVLQLQSSVAERGTGSGPNLETGQRGLRSYAPGTWTPR